MIAASDRQILPVWTGNFGRLGTAKFAALSLDKYAFTNTHTKILSKECDLSNRVECGPEMHQGRNRKRHLWKSAATGLMAGR